MPIKILLVDDQALFRGALRAYLRTIPDVELVGEASDGVDAVRMASELVPDVVLMDLSLPDIDGIEATRRIHVLLPATPVLMLSGFADESTRQDAVSAGAAGLVDKSRAIENLLPAIRAVTGGAHP